MKKRFCFFLTLVFILAGAAAADAQKQKNGERTGIPFDGSNGYRVDLTKTSLSGEGFSASVWVRTEKAVPSQIFLSLGGVAEDFTFYLYKRQVRFLVRNGKEENNYSSLFVEAPEPNTWTHYLGTYDGETIRVYKNGELAGTKEAKRTRTTPFGTELFLGTLKESERNFFGALDDITLWNRVLSPEEAAALFHREELAESPEKPGPISVWSGDGLKDGRVVNGVRGASDAERIDHDMNPLLNTRDDGFRGIWYYVGKTNDEYCYKYSGGLGTYPANHFPFAVYAPEVNKTFFCYGGVDKEGKTLLHEVAYFDHAKKTVSRPTIILDKKTNDAHDNPVISLDDDGYIWIFSTSHGTARLSWVHKSRRPYDISEFELVKPVKMVDGREVPMNNFSYLQVYHAKGKGFVALFTTYDQGLLNDPDTRADRCLFFMTSKDGVHWSSWQPIAGMAMGHYQNGAVSPDGSKIGTAFNYHPYLPEKNKVGLNYRTNLYYIESGDLGGTWRTIDGKPVKLPLLSDQINGDALVRDYEAEDLNVYITDTAFDKENRPAVLYITSKGYRPGPENGPYVWTVARWTGTEWTYSNITESDHNYDFGSLYIGDDGVWRMIGTDGMGPQRYSTGGEISLWQSGDAGKTWTKTRQMTSDSKFNHCYPRRPINPNPDFYALWADGNGREPSESSIYFCNRDGDVFKLPRKMTGDEAAPEKVSP